MLTVQHSPDLSSLTPRLALLCAVLVLRPSVYASAVDSAISQGSVGLLYIDDGRLVEVRGALLVFSAGGQGATRECGVC